jgi:hypothetical protein
MDAFSISRLIFDTVPQIYEDDEGQHPAKLNVSP